jgi:hypothetical protein
MERHICQIKEVKFTFREMTGDSYDFCHDLFNKEGKYLNILLVDEKYFII